MTRHWLLLPILVLAAALRVAQLGYGLPNLLHPDEWRLLRPAARMARAPEQGLHPGFFNYPALQTYVLAGSLAVADRVSEPSPQAPGDRARVVRDVRLARAITAAFGVATVGVAYALGWLCGGPMLAALAGALLAVAPYPVLDSHYANVDVPMTFWVALATAAALAYASSRRRGWLLGAGAAIGLAAATKYPALAAAAVIPAACLAARREDEGVWPALAPAVPALGLAAAAFAAGAPYTFLDFEGFRAGFLQEVAHMGEGHVGFDLAPGGWVYHPAVYQLAAGLPFALGLPLYLLALAGGVGALWRHRPPALLLLAAGLPLFAVVAVSQVVFVRYLLPLLPFLAVAAAGAGAALLRHPRRGLAAAGGAALAAVFAYTTAFSLSQLGALEPQNGVAASHWIRENVPSGAVHIAGMPWMLDLDAQSHPVRRFKLERVKRQRSWPRWLVVSSWYTRAYERGSLRRREEHAFASSLDSPGSRYETLARFECSYLNQRLYARLDPGLAHQFACLEFSVHRLRQGRR